MTQDIPILNQGFLGFNNWSKASFNKSQVRFCRQGDVLAALAKDPSIKAPIAIGNWSNAVESDPEPSPSSGFAPTLC